MTLMRQRIVRYPIASGEHVRLWVMMLFSQCKPNDSIHCRVKPCVKMFGDAEFFYDTTSEI